MECMEALGATVSMEAMEAMVFMGAMEAMGAADMVAGPEATAT